MGTKYVDWNLGTDDPAYGGSPGAGAYKTVTYAIGQCPSGDTTVEIASATYAGTLEPSSAWNGKNITLHGDSRSGVVIEGSTADYGTIDTLSATTGELILSNLTLARGNSTGALAIVYSGHYLSRLRLVNVTMDHDSPLVTFRSLNIQPTTTSAMDFEVVACDEVNVSANSSASILVQGLASFVLTGTEFDTTGGIGILVYDKIASATIQNNSFNRPGKVFLSCGSAGTSVGITGGALWEVIGNVVTAGRFIYQYKGNGTGNNYNWIFDGNVCTRAGTGAGSVTFVGMGGEGEDKPGERFAKLGSITFKNNSFTVGSVDSAHHLFDLAGGVDDPIIEYNSFIVTNLDSTDWMVVLKCQRPIFRYNYVYGPKCVYLVGCGAASVTHNTIWARRSAGPSGGYTVGWTAQDDGDTPPIVYYPTDSIIKDNILVEENSDGQTVYGIQDVDSGEGYGFYDIICDYNFYQTVSGAFVGQLDGTNCLTLPLLKLKWSTYASGTPSANNDTHSIQGVAGLIDPPGGDYTWEAGFSGAEAASDGTDMGRWQRGHLVGLCSLLGNELL